MRRFVVLSVLAAVIAASALADDAAGREALLKADRDFAAAAQTRGVEAWVEAWAANGVHPDGPGIAVGKDGIRKQMAPQYAAPGFKLEWSVSRAEISKGGNVGTTWGRYKSTSTKDGKTTVRTGDYVTVWEKQDDHSWKVVYDTGDRDPEPPARK
jgi:ketosteroid isomerase-like protein